jgi:hypothetical protein
MIRLHGSEPLQWLTGGFEVAVPVAPRSHDDAQYSVAQSVGESLPAD